MKAIIFKLGNSQQKLTVNFSLFSYWIVKCFALTSKFVNLMNLPFLVIISIVFGFLTENKKGLRQCWKLQDLGEGLLCFFYKKL